MPSACSGRIYLDPTAQTAFRYELSENALGERTPANIPQTNEQHANHVEDLVVPPERAGTGSLAESITAGSVILTPIAIKS
jgi:hypothetical protein